jgi:Zn ribbon nucleic-acid-binding protein
MASEEQVDYLECGECKHERQVHGAVSHMAHAVHTLTVH